MGKQYKPYSSSSPMEESPHVPANPIASRSWVGSQIVFMFEVHKLGSPQLSQPPLTFRFSFRQHEEGLGNSITLTHLVEVTTGMRSALLIVVVFPLGPSFRLIWNIAVSTFSADAITTTHRPLTLRVQDQVDITFFQFDLQVAVM